MSGSCAFCEIVAGTRRQEVVLADERVVALRCEPPAAAAASGARAPWRPPEGGEAERRRVVAAVRARVAAQGASL